MKSRFALLALSLTFFLAAPAFAGKGASLTPTNNTVAGPGVTSVAAGDSERIFSHPGATDVCVTVANSGKVAIEVSITGVSSAATDVPAGGSLAVCSKDTTAIDLNCNGESTCSAGWRVDDV